MSHRMAARNEGFLGAVDSSRMVKQGKKGEVGQRRGSVSTNVTQDTNDKSTGVDRTLMLSTIQVAHMQEGHLSRLAQ